MVQINVAVLLNIVPIGRQRVSLCRSVRHSQAKQFKVQLYVDHLEYLSNELQLIASSSILAVAFSVGISGRFTRVSGSLQRTPRNLTNYYC
jgi:hypothetical protein